MRETYDCGEQFRERLQREGRQMERYFMCPGYHRGFSRPSKLAVGAAVFFMSSVSSDADGRVLKRWGKWSPL
jgi:hypothetical protein